MPTNLRSRGVGKRFEAADLERVDRKLFAVAFKYMDKAPDYLRDGRGLLLSGPPGIGKTYTIAAMMIKLLENRPRFDFLFVTAPDLFERVNSREQVPYWGKTWFEVYSTVKALVINDLGKEDRSRDYRSEEIIVKLGRILRRRHEEQLPIFVTTNIPLVATTNGGSTVEMTYGKSLWSLMYDLTAFRAQVHGDDRRKLVNVPNGDDAEDEG